MKIAMLDIETLAAESRARVIQIAAIVWESGNLTLPKSKPEKLEDYIFPTFSMLPDINYQQNRVIDPSTITFWMDMPDLYKRLTTNPSHPQHCLQLFSEWYKEHKPEYCLCYGATFDHVIVQSLYNDFKMKNPIHYRDQLDMRTMVRQSQIKCPELPTWIENHNALHDCVRQAIWCEEIFKQVK